jgi:hypothetical protein
VNAPTNLYREHHQPWQHAGVQNVLLSQFGDNDKLDHYASTVLSETNTESLAQSHFRSKALKAMYLLTPHSTVLLEKLTSLCSQSRNFPQFYVTRRFFTVLTIARHLSLSWADSIQSPHPTPISGRSILILSSHLHLSLPNGFYSLWLPHQDPVHTSLLSHTRHMTRPSLKAML